MQLTVAPGDLSGSVPAPASKSFVHRQLIAAALADGPTDIRFGGFSQDIAATAACLREMGVGCAASAAGLYIQPLTAPPRAGAVLDAGESGSTARFILPAAAAAAAAWGQPARFDLVGHGRLPGRPMADLCAALRAHGCAVSADTLPLQLSGSLRSGVFALPGNVSSQYITGLLLALPILPGDSDIRLTSPLASAGYIHITLAVLAIFGVTIQPTHDGWHIPGGQTYHTPGRIESEGDWSNGAFWLVADALLRAAGRPGITVTGLAADSVQGDRAVLQAIQAITAGKGGCTLDVNDIPDLVPALAVLAAAQDGTTVFTGAARLRLKESDRIATIAAMLQALGGKAEAGPDTLTVHGGKKLAGGRVDGAGDHRIVMAAAVASILCESPVTIVGAEAAAKSYPGFFDDWRKLGGFCRQSG